MKQRNILKPSDSRTPLYAATYEGERLSAIASTVPGRDAIYLANESLRESDRNQTGIVRLKWPKELR